MRVPSPSARVMAPWSGAVIKFSLVAAAVENSDPAWNNPGDLTGMDSGQFQTNGFGNSEGVWKFVNIDDGWTALFMKINRVFSDKSSIYPLTMTLEQFGTRYSGGDPNWGRDAGQLLGVPETITMAQLASQLKV
jgi:hypothetical protein